MSTARPTLAATHREVTGKKVAALRRGGRLPAVVFGHGSESTNVSIDGHDFELLRREIGANALVDLSIDGKKAKPVLVHGVQVHPVHRRPLHVDLFLVRMTQELTVDVPLVAVDTAPAVELQNGTLLHPIESVKVRALPDHLPQAIEYSVAGLETFDDVVHVSDLAIPGDVTLLTELDEVVARVLAPRVELEPVFGIGEGEAAPEGEAAGEAAAAEGAPSDGGDAEAGSTEG
jgi:large subunit ribosomal protein L25